VSTGREPRFPYQARLDDLLRLYDEAQRALIAQVEAAVAAGRVNTARGRRAQLAALLRYLEDLGRRTDPVARQVVQAAYAESAARTAQQIAGLAFAAPELPGAFASVSAPALRALEESMLGRLEDARQTVGRRINDVFARAQRASAIQALAGVNASPQAAARALERNLRAQRVTAFVDRAGRQWDLSAYSRMAMRTVTREAVVQGSIDRMLSHSINLARVSDHNTKCPVCAPWEGRLIALAGDVQEFQGEPVSDTGDGIPPIHPNCEHTLQPVATTLQGGVG